MHFRFFIFFTIVKISHIATVIATFLDFVSLRTHNDIFAMWFEKSPLPLMLIKLMNIYDRHIVTNLRRACFYFRPVTMFSHN